MNAEDKWRLTSNRMYLLDNLDVLYVSNWLISGGILTEDEVEELTHIANPRDRAAKLLNWLPRKGPAAYGIFRRCLGESETQRHIIPVLDATDISTMPKNTTDVADARRVGGAGGTSRPTGTQSQPSAGGATAQQYNVQVIGDKNIVVTGSHIQNITINR